MSVFYSGVTAKGNSSYSYDSQQDAEEKALLLDKMNCKDCTYCTYCKDCTDCTNCKDCTNCTNCTYCTYCKDCTNCTDCTDCTICTSQPICITGLLWPICIRSNNTIKIGCQDHSLTFWKNASNETIAKMDENATSFWTKYKNTILALAETMNT